MTKQKFKFFLFFFIIFLFALFFLGAVNIEKKTTNPFIQSIKSILPANVKAILKKTVFIIPSLHKKVQLHEITINQHINKG